MRGIVPVLAIGLLAFAAFVLPVAQAQTNQSGVPLDILAKPLSRTDALEIALRQNSAVLKSKTDLEASYGVVLQLRSVAFPKVAAVGDFTATQPSGVEQFPIPSNSPVAIFVPSENWSAQLQVVQPLYQGGQINSALRSSKLTREQARLNYETVVADTLLAVRTAYDNALFAMRQIDVREASVKLLTRELEDSQRRFRAGIVPRFNVLRAEVELANAQPKLIQARNAYRIAKANLVNLLGYNLDKSLGDDIPLQLTSQLETALYEIELSTALGKALQNRTELGSLRKAERLRHEDVVSARAGYKPSAQAFAGYGSRSPSLTDNLGHGISGWFAGAQVSWNLFDGQVTRGRVVQAEALHERARLDLEDASRRIELEVRTAHSEFIEAKEVLESQKKVLEQAQEALRLSEARSEAGTGTQLDVLSAQTALTDARTVHVRALRDYSVARARLERAIGEYVRLDAEPSK